MYLSQVPLSALTAKTTEPTFEEWLDFTATKPAGKRKCVKPTAFPCGNTCLASHTKTGKPVSCKKVLTGQARSHAGWLKLQGQAHGGGVAPTAKNKANDVATSDVAASFSYAKNSDFKKVGDIEGLDIVQDKKGNNYVAKRAGAMMGVAAYDNASEIIGGHLIKQIGGKTADLAIQEDNDPDTSKLMYSKFVPGESLAAIRAKKPGSLDSVDNLMLSNPKALNSAIKHPDLARIHAADVFMRNGDRHDGNLFYSDKDGYHAIDNEGAFYDGYKSSFSGYVTKAVESSVSTTLKRTSLNKNELDNLKIFKESLEKTIKSRSKRIIQGYQFSHLRFPCR